MGYKVIFAPQALEELEQIIRFIAQDDPAAAERAFSRVARKVRAENRKLGLLALSGQTEDQFASEILASPITIH